MEITSFNRFNLKEISKEIELALEEVGNKYGLDFSMGGIKFSPTTFHCKLEAAITSEEGSTIEEVKFKQNAIYFGVKPEDYQKQVFLYGKRYNLIGIKPSAHKYPFICKECNTGKRYKFPKHAVTNALGHTV